MFLWMVKSDLVGIGYEERNVMQVNLSLKACRVIIYV